MRFVSFKGDLNDLLTLFGRLWTCKATLLSGLATSDPKFEIAIPPWLLTQWPKSIKENVQNCALENK